MSQIASTQAFIMIIDDSLTVRKLLQVSLSREGYQGITFADGIMALNWLTESTRQAPDLIVLDLFLPFMNGYQVARVLRSLPHCKHLPIVMLTRRNQMIDRLQARLAGINSYLTKPFTTHQIVSTVRGHLPAKI